MEIKINTANILGDETTIRDEVIDQIANAFQSEMRKSAQSLVKETLVKETLEKALVNTVNEKVAEIVNMHLDTEFTERDTYGRVGETNTVRNKIADILAKQCVFKQTHYSNEQNAFTKAVMDTVATEMRKFQKEYTSMVTAQVVKECADEAASKLKKATGVK